MNYALIENEVVVNIFVCADDEAASSLYPNDLIVNVSVLDTLVQIGFAYLNGVFSAPAAPKPSQAELVAQADSQKSYMMTIATENINVLQDATDPDVMGDNITPGDIDLLNLWKQYRVLLMRVDVSNPPGIVWPIQPA